MQSWFRTAQEIQGPNIWAGAYYLGDASGSTGNDHSSRSDQTGQPNRSALAANWPQLR
jgi:hypothetical protein